MAARALIDAGYRRVIWTGHLEQISQLGDTHYSLAKRYEGVMSVLKDTGIDLQMCGLHYGVDEPESWPRLLNEVKKILASPDVGVICYNTSIASQWSNAALELGLRVGHDFGLVCCDSSYTTCLDWPGLSRALFDRFDMGIQAAEMMLRVLKHPEFQCVSRLITPQWHQGKTIRTIENKPLV